ncbi:superoxide dismutase [Chitinispirillales bacterium ANBcel5]|uniref:superoxide dismutase n=1 Tax=Cellulosispirillum alkaliphilum TaxID=3039283 RepID=UPI002A56F06D|nr:superoxide dismutase [Chitinispirillales bacterium ANBcel5]
MEIAGLNEIKANAPFTLPPLPYSLEALAPHISEKTLSFHYQKHHQKYVDTTNDLIKGSQFEKSNLVEIINSTSDNKEFQKLFNNAAQVWNHWFYWNCLDPRGSKKPQGTMMQAIESSFSSYESFINEFSQAAIAQFGSGYAWLVKDGEGLKVIKTPNAENPLAKGLQPIIGIDVWEHAYYLDYQNKRQEYVAAVVNNMINWEFAQYSLENDITQ